MRTRAVGVSRSGAPAPLSLLLVGGPGCDEMAQALPDIQQRNPDVQLFRYRNYSLGWLEISDDRLAWRNYDSVTGKEVDRLDLIRQEDGRIETTAGRESGSLGTVTEVLV